MRAAQSPIVAWEWPPQSGFCSSANSAASTTDCGPGRGRVTCQAGAPAGSRPCAGPGQRSSPRCGRGTGVRSGPLPWPARVGCGRARGRAEETSPPSQLCKELNVKNNLDDLADEVFYRGHNVQTGTSERPREAPICKEKSQSRGLPSPSLFSFSH